jgi:hypothetical protein
LISKNFFAVQIPLLNKNKYALTALFDNFKAKRANNGWKREKKL